MRKRKDGTFEGTENGTILHFVLEKFFGDVRDGKINDKQDAAQKASEYFDLAIKENHFEVLLEKRIRAESSHASNKRESRFVKTCSTCKNAPSLLRTCSKRR